MGVVVYKRLSLKQLVGVFTKGVKDVSALVIMFPMTLIFSRLMTLNHIPELVAEVMLGITNNRIGLILLIDILLFLIGFFLDWKRHYTDAGAIADSNSKRCGLIRFSWPLLCLYRSELARSRRPWQPV